MTRNVADSLLGHFRSHETVLIDAESQQQVTRAHIDDRAAQLGALTQAGELAFLLNDGRVESARDFHALFESGTPFALLDVQTPADQLQVLFDRYSPELVAAPHMGPAPQGWHSVAERVWRRVRDTPATPAHRELAVLLSTSGSTGSPKFVRASRSNIVTNATQIAESLRITAADRGVTSLPIHYSFGMSVLTSHAMAGSPVVVSSASVIEPAFWQGLGEHGVTTVAGVPQTYLMLKRLRFADRWMPEAPQLRTMLQAGGHLDPASVREIAHAMASRGGDFVVMYGQTEAAPRMAYVPPERLSDKPGSVGIAVPGGQLSVRGEDGTLLSTGQHGQVHYRGPNVMMGYATQRSDLGLGDVQGDTLATGDIGYLDAEGYLYLTGRENNFAKIAGVRVSLDEVERFAAEYDLPPCVAVEDEPGVVTLVHTDQSAQEGLRAEVARLTRNLRLPARSLRLHYLPRLPLLSNGKVDRAAVVEVLQASQRSSTLSDGQVDDGSDGQTETASESDVSRIGGEST